MSLFNKLKNINLTIKFFFNNKFTCSKTKTRIGRISSAEALSDGFDEESATKFSIVSQHRTTQATLSRGDL